MNDELRFGFKPKVKSQTGGEQTKKFDEHLNGKSNKQELAGNVCGHSRKDNGKIRFGIPKKVAGEENEFKQETRVLRKLK